MIVSTIPRFRKDISSNYFKQIPNILANYTVDESLDSNTIVYYPLIDTIPDNSVNASIDISIYTLSPSSIKFTNGYISTGLTSDINYFFTFQGFIYLHTNYSPLISIQDISNNNLFSISYNFSLSSLLISRYISTDTYQVTNIPLVLSKDTWYHISVNRNYENLRVYVNTVKVAEINDYWYSILPGTVYIGKDNSSTLQGNLSNVQLINRDIYPVNYFNPDNIGALRLIKLVKNPANEYADFRLINFIRSDHCNNIIHSPNQYINDVSNTSFNPLLSEWTIKPSDTNIDVRKSTKGFVLLSDVYMSHPETFTIDFGFRLPTIVNDDVILFSNWKSNNTKYFYFVYKKDSGYVKFIYLKQNSNTTYNQAIFSTLPLGTLNHISLQVDIPNNSIKIFLNGKLGMNLTSKLKCPTNLDYWFNYNVDNNINTSTDLYLKYFTLTSCVKYTGNNFIPYTPSKNYFKVPYSGHIVKYHSLENSYSNKVIDNVDFDVSTNFTLEPGINNSVTINQRGNRAYPVTYISKLELVGKSELVPTDYVLTTPSVPINPGSTYTSFNLGVLNPGNVYKGKFNLVLSNTKTTKKYQFNINNNYVPILSPITSISNYVDAFIAKSTSNQNQLTNLSNTIVATTTSQFVNSASFGYGYKITQSSDSINLPSAITNIRTVFFVYKELQMTPNRTYVGSSTGYTFNGGTNGGLVGDRLLGLNDYVNAQTVNTKSIVVKIAKNDSIYFLTDELFNKALIYSKNTLGIWSSTPVILNTEIIGNNVLKNSALYINTTGNLVVLGVKNASNGEGIVQVWKLSESGWIKDLDLGSAISSPYYGGFGYSVAITDDGLKLYVSELGANNGSENRVYEFSKTGDVWSAIPTHTFTGTGNFGYQIDISSDGKYLGILESDTKKLKIYTFNSSDSSWLLAQTISDVETFSLAKNATYLVTSQYTTSLVTIYQLVSDTWTSVKTITNAVLNFGYAIDTDNEHNVLVGSPLENKVYLYSYSDNWTAPLITSSSEKDYGYTVSRSYCSNLISSYTNVVDLYTNNGAAIPQNIISVRQNSVTKQLGDYLGMDYSILTFQSSSGLSIDKIGAGKSGTSLNGVFMGLVMFSRLLSLSEISTVEDTLARYLKLFKYSFYV